MIMTYPVQTHFENVLLKWFSAIMQEEWEGSHTLGLEEGLCKTADKGGGKRFSEICSNYRVSSYIERKYLYGIKSSEYYFCAGQEVQ